MPIYSISPLVPVYISLYLVNSQVLEINRMYFHFICKLEKPITPLLASLTLLSPFHVNSFPIFSTKQNIITHPIALNALYWSAKVRTIIETIV